MEAIQIVIRRQVEDICDGVIFELKNPPPLLELLWAICLITALIIPFYNAFSFPNPYERAPYIWFAWVFYAASVVIAVKIYQIPGSPNPRDPKKTVRRTLSIVISILFGMAAVIYNVSYYFVSDEFNHHRFQVEQTECKNQIKAFLLKQKKPVSSTDACFPELVSPPPGMEGDQNAWCTSSYTETRYGFWRWLWLATTNYFGAVGTSTVVFNNSSIKATASWAPITSHWYKIGGTKATRIEQIANANVICVHTQQPRTTCKPRVTQVVKPQTPDPILMAIATIHQINDEDVIQVKVRTHLSVDQDDFPVKEYEVGGAKIDVNSLNTLPKSFTPSMVTFHYRCNQGSLRKTNISLNKN